MPFLRFRFFGAAAIVLQTLLIFQGQALFAGATAIAHFGGSENYVQDGEKKGSDGPCVAEKPTPALAVLTPDLIRHLRKQKLLNEEDTARLVETNKEMSRRVHATTEKIRITNPGLTDIAKVKKYLLENFGALNPKIKELDLTGLKHTFLGDSMVSLLAQIAEQFPNLRILKLPRVQIHSSHLMTLQSAAKRGLLQKLEELDLRWTEVGDQGISALDALPGLQVLRTRGSNVLLSDFYSWVDSNKNSEVSSFLQYHHGVMNLYGFQKGQPDLKAAVKWFEKAEETKSEQAESKTLARFQLGYLFENGFGVARDLKAAQQWYERAAENGNVEARFQAERVRFIRLTLPEIKAEDFQARLAELHERAEKGSVRAQIDLGVIYGDGLGGLQGDWSEAKRWLNRAIESKDDSLVPLAKTRLARLYRGAGFLDQAQKLYEQAAEKGFAWAQNECAFNLIEQERTQPEVWPVIPAFVLPSMLGKMMTEKAARQLFEMAARQGLAVAQVNLGWLMEGMKEEVDLVRTAALQGDPDAQATLGYFYMNGTGVPRDRRMAVKFYKLAAEQGHQVAKINLRYTNQKLNPEDRIALDPASTDQVLARRRQEKLYLRGSLIRSEF